MSNVEQITENFRFHDKKHAYEYKKDGEWKPMTGVTTILNVIAKPGLTWWASGMACKHLGWKHYKYNGKKKRKESAQESLERLQDMDAEEFLDELDEAYKAHVTSRDDAAKKGTDVHELVEDYANWCIKNHNGIATPFENDEGEQINNFIDWATDNDIVFLESEKRVFSLDNWFAGTFDLLFKKDGKTFMGDVKTGKRVYPTYFVQMGGYQLALDEMDDVQPHGAAVIRLGKDGSFETEYSYALERDTEMFLAALKLYRGLETFKS